jgi:hypothetical protein
VHFFDEVVMVGEVNVQPLASSAVHRVAVALVSNY